MEGCGTTLETLKPVAAHRPKQQQVQEWATVAGLDVWSQFGQKEPGRFPFVVPRLGNVDDRLACLLGTDGDAHRDDQQVQIDDVIKQGSLRIAYVGSG